jgi:DNA invertase Pin-like site-specific DNA recombinase
MVHNTLMNVAQFEREMMLERQREGIAKAKREGKYMGRKPTAREKADEVKALSEDQEAGLEAQIRDLKAAGVAEENIYFEQLSSVDERRYRPSA